MGFWTDAKENSGGGGQAAYLPDGTHDVTIAKYKRTKQDGTEFRSRKGDAQVLLVVKGDAGEAAEFLTLSQAAAWRLVPVLEAVGLSLKELDAKGITLEDFEDEDFGTQQLVGQQCRVRCEHIEGEKYPKLTFMKARKPVTTPDDRVEPDEDSIPF